MLKKVPPTRICMCCGEKKQIPVDKSYCKDCSTSNVGSFFAVTETSGKSMYNSRRK